MSRIGNKPIPVLDGVKIAFANGTFSAEGPKGKLEYKIRPEIEVEMRGESQRNLIYWMLETEFKTKDPRNRWFFRVHHRSDAWGTMDKEGGSNALVFGFRRSF